jgi:hypothetical protein
VRLKRRLAATRGSVAAAGRTSENGKSGHPDSALLSEVGNEDARVTVPEIRCGRRLSHGTPKGSVARLVCRQASAVCSASPVSRYDCAR